MARIVRPTARQVKPILSLDREEARRRVLNLYKAWYRQIPYIRLEYDVPATEKQCFAKLREVFLKNKDITDLRIIDSLVIRGQMELVETIRIWKQKTHIMAYFKDTVEPRPTDFMSKFIAGQD